MAKRPPAVLAPLVFAVVGLLVGLEDQRRLSAFLLERFSALQKLPHPRSVSWIGGLRGSADLVETLDVPLKATLVVLLLVAFALLGRILNPHFRLWKPLEENPGRGPGLHLDKGRLLRAGGAVLLSLWLAGALAPLAALIPYRGPGPGPALLLLGGITLWTAAFPGILGPLLLSLALCLLLWLIWGSRGLATPEGEMPRREIALWGLAAGAAALPAVLAGTAGRVWLAQAAVAYPLSDRVAWTVIRWLALLVPVLAGLLLAFVAASYRPRPGLLRRRPLLGAASAALVVGSLLLAGAAQAHLRSLDAGAGSLARLLNLHASPLTRAAVLLTPLGRTLYTTTADGSDNGTGTDRIACDGRTVTAVEEFLRRRRYRSELVFRAFTHLHDCASLDWLSERSLELDLEMLERAPTPAAAELLMERFHDCPVTKRTRRVLDRIADGSRFVWSGQAGRRWLGATYLRFGDSARAREYLLSPEAGLTPQEIGQAFRGLAPLPDGIVRGRMTLQGTPREGMRLGLIRADKRVPGSGRPAWLQMVPACRPFEWRHVVASAHTDRTGQFRFSSIPEGRYFLVITGGPIGRDRGTPTVSRHPGAIEVDQLRRDQRVPDFDLRIDRPVPVRPDGPPASTAARPAPSAAG